MNRLSSSFSLLLLCLLSGPALLPATAQERKYGAFGSTLHHRDGSRTEKQKMGDSNQIREVTFDKNNICVQSRLFQVDNSGNLMNGVLWDGRGNRLGCTRYIYHEVTGQLLEERFYNKEGKLIRRLFYPGALNNPKYARRLVAFNYDPNLAPEKQVPKESTGNVKPVAPIKEAQDEFDPSLPTGDGGSPVIQSPENSTGPKTTKPAGRSFFRKKAGA